MEQGFHEKYFKKTRKQVAKMDRKNCYEIKSEKTKTTQTTLVTKWYPKLIAITSSSKNNFH